MITNNGTLRLSNFNRLVRSCIGDQLLRELGCSLNGKGKDNWARRIVKGRDMHPGPVRHMLVICSLGMEVGQFLSLSSSLAKAPGDDFEQGPWPCLNPVCVHHNQPVIEEKLLRVDERGQLFGIFSCECGYTYSRRGPDPAGRNREKAHKVIGTGTIWDNALRKLWAQTGISVYKIGAALHSYHYPIMQAVKRLHLPLNRSRLKPPPLVHKEKRKAAKELTREHYREYFLAHRAKHPQETRTELQRGGGRIGKVTNWLSANDPDWLWEHMPKRARRAATQRPQKKTGIRERRDKALQVKVQSARKSLLARTGRPQRITRNALLIELGYSHGIDRNKFPRTLRAVSAAEEALEECAARRVYWLLEHSDARFASLAQLKEEARIRLGWEKHPAIAEALEYAAEIQIEQYPPSGKASRRLLAA